jgi:hypothetical protein
MTAGIGDPEPKETSVRAEPDAAAFIRQRGGRLYIWIDGAGVKRVRVRPPRSKIEFCTVAANGFELLHDVRIDRPSLWAISLKRFPLRHIEALYNGEEPYYWIATGS